MKLSEELITSAPHVRILRLRCSGPFDHSGHYLYDFGAEALVRTAADAVLLDLSELDYTWGDDLLLAFQIPLHRTVNRQRCPLAVIVGPKSQLAIETLLVEEAFFDDWRDADFVFKAEQPAIDWLSRNAPGIG